MASEFCSWWDFNKFTTSVQNHSRFIHDESVFEFLSTLLHTSSNRHRAIPQGRVVWRAQLGNDFVEREQDHVSWMDPVPYTAERMKPKLFSAPDGRANPKGIPYLYVSDDRDTAMSEVRPWLGAMVSIAQLELTKDITLVDFSVAHDDKPVFYFEEPPAEKKETAVWAHVDHAFSEPVDPDPGCATYVSTQIISEFFRNKGFDGVVYKSRLGDGFNIALFDIAVANVVSCSLFTTKGLTYSFGEEPGGYSVKKSNSKF
jgi:RES domain